MNECKGHKQDSDSRYCISIILISSIHPSMQLTDPVSAVDMIHCYEFSLIVILFS